MLGPNDIPPDIPALPLHLLRTVVVPPPIDHRPKEVIEASLGAIDRYYRRQKLARLKAEEDKDLAKMISKPTYLSFAAPHDRSTTEFLSTEGTTKTFRKSADDLAFVAGSYRAQSSRSWIGRHAGLANIPAVDNENLEFWKSIPPPKKLPPSEIDRLDDELREAIAPMDDLPIRVWNGAFFASYDELQQGIDKGLLEGMSQKQKDQALCLAVLFNDVNTTKLLIEFGARGDGHAIRTSPICCGYTAVHSAIARGQHYILFKLARQCWDVQRCLYDGPVIKELVATGFMKEQASHAGTKRLSGVAIAFKFRQALSLAIMTQLGVLHPNAEVWPGSGPALCVAIENGLIDFAEALIKKGADPNCYIPRTGNTPTLLAAALDTTGQTFARCIAAGGDPLLRNKQRHDSFLAAALRSGTDDGVLRHLLASPMAPIVRVPRLILAGNYRPFEAMEDQLGNALAAAERISTGVSLQEFGNGFRKADGSGGGGLKAKRTMFGKSIQGYIKTFEEVMQEKESARKLGLVMRGKFDEIEAKALQKEQEEAAKKGTGVLAQVEAASGLVKTIAAVRAAIIGHAPVCHPMPKIRLMVDPTIAAEERLKEHMKRMGMPPLDVVPVPAPSAPTPKPTDDGLAFVAPAAASAASGGQAGEEADFKLPFALSFAAQAIAGQDTSLNFVPSQDTVQAKYAAVTAADASPSRKSKAKSPREERPIGKAAAAAAQVAASAAAALASTRTVLERAEYVGSGDVSVVKQPEPEFASATAAPLSLGLPNAVLPVSPLRAATQPSPNIVLEPRPLALPGPAATAAATATATATAEAEASERKEPKPAKKKDKLANSVFAGFSSTLLADYGEQGGALEEDDNASTASSSTGSSEMSPPTASDSDDDSEGRSSDDGDSYDDLDVISKHDNELMTKDKKKKAKKRKWKKKQARKERERLYGREDTLTRKRRKEAEKFSKLAARVGVRPPPEAIPHRLANTAADKLEGRYKGVTYLHAMTVAAAVEKLTLLLETPLPPYFIPDDDDPNYERPFKSIDRLATSGAPALTDGCLSGSVQCSRVLLDLGGADPNISHEWVRSKQEKWHVPMTTGCPLNAAVLQGSEETVANLLLHDANPCILDTTGFMPLLHAALMFAGSQIAFEGEEARRQQVEADKLTLGARMKELGQLTWRGDRRNRYDAYDTGAGDNDPRFAPKPPKGNDSDEEERYQRISANYYPKPKEEEVVALNTSIRRPASASAIHARSSRQTIKNSGGLPEELAPLPPVAAAALIGGGGSVGIFADSPRSVAMLTGEEQEARKDSAAANDKSAREARPADGFAWEKRFSSMAAAQNNVSSQALLAASGSVYPPPPVSPQKAALRDSPFVASGGIHSPYGRYDRELGSPSARGASGGGGGSDADGSKRPSTAYDALVIARSAGPSPNKNTRADKTTSFGEMNNDRWYDNRQHSGKASRVVTASLIGPIATANKAGDNSVKSLQAAMAAGASRGGGKVSAEGFEAAATASAGAALAFIQYAKGSSNNDEDGSPNRGPRRSGIDFRPEDVDTRSLAPFSGDPRLNPDPYTIPGSTKIQRNLLKAAAEERKKAAIFNNALARGTALPTPKGGPTGDREATGYDIVLNGIYGEMNSMKGAKGTQADGNLSLPSFSDGASSVGKGSKGQGQGSVRGDAAGDDAAAGDKDKLPFRTFTDRRKRKERREAAEKAYLSDPLHVPRPRSDDEYSSSDDELGGPNAATSSSAKGKGKARFAPPVDFGQLSPKKMSPRLLPDVPTPRPRPGEGEGDYRDGEDEDDPAFGSPRSRRDSDDGSCSTARQQQQNQPFDPRGQLVPRGHFVGRNRFVEEIAARAAEKMPPGEWVSSERSEFAPTRNKLTAFGPFAKLAAEGAIEDKDEAHLITAEEEERTKTPPLDVVAAASARVMKDKATVLEERRKARAAERAILASYHGQVAVLEATTARALEVAANRLEDPYETGAAELSLSIRSDKPLPEIEAEVRQRELTEGVRRRLQQEADDAHCYGRQLRLQELERCRYANHIKALPYCEHQPNSLSFLRIVDMLTLALEGMAVTPERIAWLSSFYFSYFTPLPKKKSRSGAMEGGALGEEEVETPDGFLDPSRFAASRPEGGSALVAFDSGTSASSARGDPLQAHDNCLSLVVNARDKIVRWSALQIAMRCLPDGHPAGLRIINAGDACTLIYGAPIPSGPIGQLDARSPVRSKANHPDNPGGGYDGIEKKDSHLPSYARGGVHNYTPLELCDALAKPFFKAAIVERIKKVSPYIPTALMEKLVNKSDPKKGIYHPKRRVASAETASPTKPSEGAREREGGPKDHFERPHPADDPQPSPRAQSKYLGHGQADSFRNPRVKPVELFSAGAGGYWMESGPRKEMVETARANRRPADADAPFGLSGPKQGVRSMKDGSIAAFGHEAVTPHALLYHPERFGTTVPPLGSSRDAAKLIPHALPLIPDEFVHYGFRLNHHNPGELEEALKKERLVAAEREAKIRGLKAPVPVKEGVPGLVYGPLPPSGNATPHRLAVSKALSEWVHQPHEQEFVPFVDPEEVYRKKQEAAAKSATTGILDHNGTVGVATAAPGRRYDAGGGDATAPIITDKRHMKAAQLARPSTSSGVPTAAKKKHRSLQGFAFA